MESMDSTIPWGLWGNSRIPWGERWGLGIDGALGPMGFGPQGRPDFQYLNQFRVSHGIPFSNFQYALHEFPWIPCMQEWQREAMIISCLHT